MLLTAVFSVVFWMSSKRRFQYCKRLIDMRARQEENHWQSCSTAVKCMQKVKTQCKILRGQKGTLYQVSHGQMETNHRHSHAIHLIHLHLRENLCSEFWSFSSFLFIDLANFNFIKLVVLSHLLFILSVKYWKYSSLSSIKSFCSHAIGLLPRHEL